MGHDRDAARSDLLEHRARTREELEVGVEVGDRLERGVAPERVQADCRRRCPQVLDETSRRLDGGQGRVVGLEFRPRDRLDAGQV